MHQIGGELHDIAPAGADRFERRLDIGESLHALRIEVAIAGQLAVLVDADLAGDEHEFRGLHAGQMRILPKRLAERVGIDEFLISAIVETPPTRRGKPVAANVIPPARRSP